MFFWSSGVSRLVCASPAFSHCTVGLWCVSDSLSLSFLSLFCLFLSVFLQVPDATTDGEVNTPAKGGGAGRLPDERNPFRKARSRMKKMLAEVKKKKD